MEAQGTKRRGEGLRAATWNQSDAKTDVGESTKSSDVDGDFTSDSASVEGCRTAWVRLEIRVPPHSSRMGGLDGVQCVLVSFGATDPRGLQTRPYPGGPPAGRGAPAAPALRSGVPRGGRRQPARRRGRGQVVAAVGEPWLHVGGQLRAALPIAALARHQPACLLAATRPPARPHSHPRSLARRPSAKFRRARCQPAPVALLRGWAAGKRARVGAGGGWQQAGRCRAATHSRGRLVGWRSKRFLRARTSPPPRKCRHAASAHLPPAARPPPTPTRALSPAAQRRPAAKYRCARRQPTRPWWFGGARGDTSRLGGGRDSAGGSGWRAGSRWAEEEGEGLASAPSR